MAEEKGLDAITDQELMELQGKGQMAPLTGAPAPQRPAAVSGVPEWAHLPPDLKIPRGKVVAFMRFEADKCEDGQEHDAVLWPLSVRDERFARQRTYGEPSRIYEEMTKGMIRAVDGKGTMGDIVEVEAFWEAIGSRYRSMLVGWYHQHHSLNDEDRLGFFARCVVTRTAT